MPFDFASIHNLFRFGEEFYNFTTVSLVPDIEQWGLNQMRAPKKMEDFA